MNVRTWSLVLAGLLLAQATAAAAPGGGLFLLEGAFEPPAGSTVSGHLLGLHSEGGARYAAITIEAPRATLHELTQQMVVAEGPKGVTYSYAPEPDERRSPLTSVRLEMVAAPRGEGWLGIHPLDAHVAFTGASDVSLEASDLTTLGRPVATGPVQGLFDGEDQPKYRNYYRTVVGDHLLGEAAGTMVVTGDLSLKILGPYLRLTSDERSAEIQTGHFAAEGAVRTESLRWLFLDLEDARVEVTTAVPVRFVVEHADVEWAGAARFTPLRGEMVADENSYAASGRRSVLDGDFDAHLAPRREADRLLTSMDVAGVLASTTLKPASSGFAPAPAGGAGALSWASLVLFGLAVMGGSAGVAVLVTRRRAPEPARAAPVPAAVPLSDDGLRADDCLRFADEAASERRWARALHWARRAREMAPHNARVHADEGEYLFQLGLFEEALVAFAAASRLDASEGYASYRGAQAAAAAGRPVDEVIGWLGRALERSPDLVGDLELFREFDNLRGLAEYDLIVRDAYERLGIDPSAPF